MISWPLGAIGAVARNGKTIEGRAIFAGSAAWVRDDRLGFPGYEESAATIEAHDAVLAAALAWLCQTPGSLSLLILAPDPTTEGINFGQQFQAALTRLGHSFVLTGSTNGLGGYDPLDFAAMLVTNYGGLTNSALDAFLDAQGRLWSAPLLGGGLDWLRYGADIGGLQTNTGSGSDYLRAFNCPAWGAGTFETVLYSDSKMTLDLGSKTRPGTSTQVANNLGEGNYVLWTQG